MDKTSDAIGQSGDLSIAECDMLIAASRRAGQAEAYKLGNCSSVLHVGYFFDGVGRNIEQDASEARLSNVAKLYRAFPDVTQNTPSRFHRKHYFSGLGTPFEDQVTDKLQLMMDRGWQRFLDEMKSLPEDTVTDTLKDTVKNGDWQEALSNSIKQLKNPKALGLTAIENLAKSVGNELLEAAPFLRDSEILSTFLLSGVDTRVDNALFLFEKSVKDAKANEIPLDLISVSLFGFDLGGTLARQFLDKLLSQLCIQDNDGIIQYQGISVDIAFVGLFDCSRHTGASQDNGLDTVSSYSSHPGVAVVGAALGAHCIAQNTPLPSVVKRSLHFIAAHERRLWRPIFRTGVMNGDNHVEMLVPGCSEDIGGGLIANEQKPSAELSLYTLREMYQAAEMACVPFTRFDDLKQLKPVVAEYFIMWDSVKSSTQLRNEPGKSARHWVTEYQKFFPQKYCNIPWMNQHLNSYFVWLGEKMYEYRLELQELEKREDKEYRFAGITGGQSGSDMRRAKATSKEVAILKQHWGWLDDVNDEAVKLYNDYHQRYEPERRSDVRFHHEGLLENIWYPAYCRAEWLRACKISAYEGLPFPQRPYWATPVDNVLFAYFVHDIQAKDKSESITANFFAIRKLELPGDDEVRIKQEKPVKKKEPVAYEPNRSLNQAFDMWGKIR